MHEASALSIYPFGSRPASSSQGGTSLLAARAELTHPSPTPDPPLSACHLAEPVCAPVSMASSSDSTNLWDEILNHVSNRKSVSPKQLIVLGELVPPELASSPSASSTDS